jgi:hypothetical protein
VGRPAKRDEERERRDDGCEGRPLHKRSVGSQTSDSAKLNRRSS